MFVVDLTHTVGLFLYPHENVIKPEVFCYFQWVYEETSDMLRVKNWGNHHEQHLKNGSTDKIVVLFSKEDGWKAFLHFATRGR